MHLHIGPRPLQRSRATAGSSQSFPEIVALVQGEIFCFDVDRAEWRQPDVDSSALNARGGRMGQRRAFAMGGGGGGGGRGRFPALHAPAVCAVDSRMFVFGGKLPAAPEQAGKRDEDGYHAWERCSSDLYALDMQTWAWTCVSDEATGYDTAQLQDNTHQTHESALAALNGGTVACAQATWQTARYVGGTI